VPVVELTESAVLAPRYECDEFDVAEAAVPTAPRSALVLCDPDPLRIKKADAHAILPGHRRRSVGSRLAAFRYAAGVK